MPISAAYQTLFIHIPKTAGSTIDYHLRQNNPELDRGKYFANVALKKFTNEEYRLCLSKPLQHLTYREMAKILPENILKDYKKFTVVRNPYDRLVSEYYFSQKYVKIYKDFEEFVRKALYLDLFTRVWLFDGHLETQTSYSINENKNFQSIDYIFKYENLNECFQYLKSITSKNVTQHLRKSLERKKFQEYYTPELKQIVQEFYKEDFINFNYSF